MEEFKSMYPRGIRVIQSYVSEVCDRMDYQNSPMYDEWPEQRVVDQICNSVCQAVSESGDMGILRDVWEFQEKKIIEKMSVDEEKTEATISQGEGLTEIDTNKEKGEIGTEELKNREENESKKNKADENRTEDMKEGAEEKNIEGAALKTENKKIPVMEKESGEEMKIEETEETAYNEEDIHQITTEADWKENSRIVESQEMRPPLRRWWNGWGINGIGPDVQGMAWGMGPMYAPVGSMGAGNNPGMQSQEMRRPPYSPHGSGSTRPIYPPQGSGPMRPPHPPQGPSPMLPPYPPHGSGPMLPPYPPQGSGPMRPPYPPQGSGPMHPPYPPQGPGPMRPPHPPHGSGPMRPPYPPQGSGSTRPPKQDEYPTWFWDIVKTLILDEMQDRRCRRGMCIN